MQTIKNKGMRVNTIAVWDKKNAGLNGGGGIAEQWEAIVFAGEIKYRKFGGNVFSVSREQHKRSESPHPHQKPLTLLAEIFDFIDGADYILDPFGGSGSTMMACRRAAGPQVLHDGARPALLRRHHRPVGEAHRQNSN